MQQIIELYNQVVIQIATPYSTGTGFYLEDYNLIVTNEHVVRGNRKVILKGYGFEKLMSHILYIDPKYDLAFIEVPDGLKLQQVVLETEEIVEQGDPVLAVGHPFGLKYTATQGIVSNTLHQQNDITYLQHDAALNPGNSGGPLINALGRVVGVNTFIIRDGNNIGFSLPVSYLKETLDEYKLYYKEFGTRCNSCTNLVFENTIEEGYCPYCGTKINLPSQIEDYTAVGISGIIENTLIKMGYDIELSRLGPNAWQIERGSAKISINYLTKSGMVIGEANLGSLPKEGIKELYVYLLKENYNLSGLSLSVKGKDIILSLILHDRFIDHNHSYQLFEDLANKADYYDDILVEKFGVQFRTLTA